MEKTSYIIIYSILIIVLIIMQKKHFKSLLTPISCFSLPWAIIGLVTNINQEENYPILNIVNIAIVVGIILFAISFAVIANKKKIVTINKKDSIRDNKTKIKESVNNNIIIIIELAIMLMMLPKLINSIQIIRSYGYRFLRANLANDEYGYAMGGVYEAILGSIVAPIIQSIVIINICQIYNNKKITKKITLSLFLTALLIIMYSLASAGRIMIIFFLIELLVITIIYKKNKIIDKFNNRKIKILAIALILFTLYLTMRRGNADSNIIESISHTAYTYLFSGPGYLSRLLENETAYGLFGQKMYGAATLGFALNLFLIPYSIITGKKIWSTYLLGSKITNKTYQISSTTSVNAMCTCFYSFIVDWGYIGIIIGPLLLGSYAAHLYKNVIVKKSLKTKIIYSGFLYVLIFSPFKLVTSGFLILIIYIMSKICIKEGLNYEEK